MFDLIMILCGIIILGMICGMVTYHGVYIVFSLIVFISKAIVNEKAHINLTQYIKYISFEIGLIVIIILLLIRMW